MTKKVKLISIAIAALAVAGVSWAAIKISGNNYKEEAASQEEVASRDISWYEEYLKKYIYIDNSSLNLFRDGLSEDAKLYIFYNASPVVWNSGEIAYEDLSSAYSKLFSGELPKENVENKRYCMPAYDYDKSKKLFTVRPGLGGCGGMDGHPRYYSISKVLDYGDKFIVRVAFGEGVGDYKPDGTVQYTLSLNNGEQVKLKCDSPQCDAEIEPKYARLDRYDFLFVKRNDTYVLDSFGKNNSDEPSGAKQTISFERHPMAWYERNTERQIIADDNYDVFRDEVDDKLKLYMAISQLSYYGDRFSYSELSEKYEQNTGEFLKKQDYELDDCYSLKFLAKGVYDNGDLIVYEVPGVFKNSQYSNPEEWYKLCKRDRSSTLRYHKIKSISETDDGYKAKVGYVEAVLKTDESTSEVWYEMSVGDEVKKFSCGYDKSNCKVDKINEFVEENPSLMTDYELRFVTNNDSEALQGVTKISG